MFKHFLVLLFLLTLAEADYKILEVTKEGISIEKTSWPIGTSGIIKHQVNDSHTAITARVEVISHDNKTHLKMLPFQDLYQDALPNLLKTPSTSDLVELGWMHNRVLVISPSQSAYQLLVKSQTDKSFINADLFALALSKEGHPSPLKEDFQLFCKSYDIGVIEFIIGQQIFKVDAHSFKVLEKIAVAFPKADVKVPFFSHLKKINADMWGEGSDEIENYSSYYLTLLGEVS